MFSERKKKIYIQSYVIIEQIRSVQNIHVKNMTKMLCYIQFIMRVIY